jgi:transcriptional regulator with GAF, ATPase, and Fis domain
VIAATNRDLLKAVGEKTFREDLYYRLNVFPIVLPPLRERSEDIPLLARFLLDKFSVRIGKPAEAISGPSLQRLQAYRWPGNIRELENVIERAIILAEGPVVDVEAEMLPGAADGSPATAPASSSLEDVERQHIRAVLDRVDWVIEGARGAAKILELHPNTLRSRMKKLGISRNAPHDPS